jgi:hypothetical protein
MRTSAIPAVGYRLLAGMTKINRRNDVCQSKSGFVRFIFAED